MPAALVDVLDDDGITAPFPVQAATLPDALAGRDILGRAQTGSGKTLGFSLPMVSRLAGGSTASAQAARPGPRADPRARHPGDGGAQAARAGDEPVGHHHLRRRRLRAAGERAAAQDRHRRRHPRPARRPDRAGRVRPVRRRDHGHRRGGPDGRPRLPAHRPAAARDDAGRRPADAVLRHARRRRRRARAALPQRPGAALGGRELLPRRDRAPRAHRRGRATASRSIAALAGGEKRSLVFTRTKHGAERLARQLTEAGIPAAELHGNLRQGARSRNLAAFTSGLARVMVATDIAARGIHIDGIDLVIHADPPAEHKAYVHRSGRTARGGADGVVVTLQTKSQARDVTAMMRKADITPHAAVAADAESDVLTEIAGPPAPRVVGDGQGLRAGAAGGPAGRGTTGPASASRGRATARDRAGPRGDRKPRDDRFRDRGPRDVADRARVRRARGAARRTTGQARRDERAPRFQRGRPLPRSTATTALRGATATTAPPRVGPRRRAPRPAGRPGRRVDRDDRGVRRPRRPAAGSSRPAVRRARLRRPRGPPGTAERPGPGTAAERPLRAGTAAARSGRRPAQPGAQFGARRQAGTAGRTAASSHRDGGQSHGERPTGATGPSATTGRPRRPVLPRRPAVPRRAASPRRPVRRATSGHSGAARPQAGGARPQASGQRSSGRATGRALTGRRRAGTLADHPGVPDIPQAGAPRLSGGTAGQGRHF